MYANDFDRCARKKRLLSDKLFFTEPPKYLGARILNQTNYMCFLDTNKPEKIVTSLLFTILDLKVACNLKNFDFFMPAFHSKYMSGPLGQLKIFCS